MAGRSQTTMARFLGRIVPNLPISSLDLSLVSKDPAVVNWMTQDPLRYHGLVRVGWAAAILKALEVHSVGCPEPFFLQTLTYRSARWDLFGGNIATLPGSRL